MTLSFKGGSKGLVRWTEMWADRCVWKPIYWKFRSLVPVHKIRSEGVANLALWLEKCRWQHLPSIFWISEEMCSSIGYTGTMSGTFLSLFLVLAGALVIAMCRSMSGSLRGLVGVETLSVDLMAPRFPVHAGQFGPDAMFGRSGVLSGSRSFCMDYEWKIFSRAKES